MAVTLKDIAERTGVSPSVVSTVLSGRDNGTFVSETTRRKVLQVAEMLNYTPVRSGRPRGSRRLRRQRTEQFIGVWDPDYSPASAFFIQNLQSALSHHAIEGGAAGDDDYGLRLLTGDDLPRLDALGIMGLVLLSPTLLPREAAAATIPCVMIGEVDHPPRELVQVHLDNHEAGRLLGEYLWELGHRHVGMVAPGAQARVGRQRWQGLQSVWSDHGGDPGQILPVAYDQFKGLGEREQVRRTTLGLFGPETPLQSTPTAIVCSDETVAAVVGQTLTELGRRIPVDVSLSAFTDTPRLGEALTPPLTTIRQPISQMASAAITQLYLLHDSDTPDQIEHADMAFPGELILRSSCGAAARS
jgi:LacI family transcriptional regulator